MQDKPSDFISQQPSSESDESPQQEEKSSGKKKLLFGSGGVAVVCIVAGTTYGLLAMNAAQQSHVADKAGAVKKVETAQSIDSRLQAYINSEQQIEDAIGTVESASAVEDASTTESLEASYADF